MKRKLLFAMLCIVSALGMRAQTWTASEVGAGNFYLYNVGKGQFLTRGNGWGTQASVSANSAMTLVLEAVGDDYKLRTNVNGDGNGLERLADPVIYTDQSASKNATWTFTKVDDASNGPVYTIVSKDNHGGGAGSYMTASAGNTIVGPADAVTDDYGRWQLVQSWITNNVPVNDANGWTVSETPTFDGSNVCAEYWNKSGASIKQTVTSLPAGSYELIAVALTRTGMTATLYAGTNTMSIATVGNDVVNGRGGANTWFNNGNGVNRLKFTLTEETASLEIGLIADNTSGDHWLVWRSFVLIYKGDPTASAKADLAEAVAAAGALNGTIPTACYNAINAIVEENNGTYSTVEEYETAIGNINNAISTYASSAIVANYARYNSIKTAAKGIASDTDTDAADAALNAADNNSDIEAAIVTLREAFLAELPNVTIPGDPGYIDVTSVMVDNASVSANVNYWTTEKTSGNGPTTNYGETEFYNANFKFYQTLALTPGTWEFGVTGFHRGGQGDFSTYFYAGTDRILIPGVASDVVNTMDQAKTYFDGGNGKVALKFLIETAGDVEIGINNQDTQTDKWTIFRDFTLKYYGAPDYSVYETQWAALVVDANDAKTAHPNVTGTELTNLNAAIADSPAGSNLKATYNEKISALQDALQTFNAAAPSYDAYVAYRDETIALWGSDLNVAAPSTAAEAIVAVQNLNIAQYDKVATDYTFSATGLIGDFGSWTGTATVNGDPAEPNYLQTEHWSGVHHAYYEQAATGWGSNAWTIKYQKTCTLPAGSYVIKVAARASVDTQGTISCSATGTTIALPNVGGAPNRGINTSGVASWSDSDTFANGNIDDNPTGNAPSVGGKGTGWQWRFLPFTLAEQTEVTMTFYAETNKQYNWMSIADGELLSTTKLAQDVAYNENADNTIENTIIADVTMTRTVKVGYNTVVLPFTLTANQVKAAFGTDCVVYNYSEDSADPNSADLTFNSGDGSINANVPVLVKVVEGQASNSQTFNGVQIVAPTSDAKATGTNFDYVGVYANTTIAEGDYFLGTKEGTQYVFQSNGTDSAKPFRAYFHKKTTGNVRANLFIDGVATAIEAIEAQPAEQNGAIFNLAGQRVNKAQKGLYIINGKKVFIK